MSHFNDPAKRDQASEEQASEAAEQRDAADEGRLEACGSIFIGPVIVNQGKVVRPSQLIRVLCGPYQGKGDRC